MMIPVTTEKDFLGGKKLGGSQPLFFITGPCVIESYALLQIVARELKKIEEKYGVLVIFKSSFDKANRSSNDSFRGPGAEDGLKMLADIKAEFNFPLLTDIHLPGDAEMAAKYVDMLQIPAFLSRQTDLLLAAAGTKKWTNVKKGQFMAPADALNIIEKFEKAGSANVTLCERGYTFGYNNLVVDMRSFEIMRQAGAHVVFDATHSTQLPGGGKVSGGQREMAFPLMRAAVATGLEGIFAEVHPNPPEAKSDSTNQLYLKDLDRFVQNALAIDKLMKT